jgi:periplasmic divalent cation tolerance protein
MAIRSALGVTREKVKKGRRRAIVVLSTAGSGKTAETIARALVAERLAACVNVLPRIRSLYRWQGKVVDDTEWLLVIKSRRSLLAALAARVRALHPYEVPEVVALEIVAGSAPYLRWLFAETRRGSLPRRSLSA